jgi:phosphopantetheinyl transferase
MISVPSQAGTHIADPTTVHPATGRQGRRPYHEAGRTGLRAGHQRSGERLPGPNAAEQETPLALEFLHHGPGVLCACIRLPYSNRNRSSRNWAKRAAVSALVPSVFDMHDEFRRKMAAGEPNMEIVPDSLGKPRLLIDGSNGPAVSFAYEGDMMWVAVGREGSSVGIDAAESASFRGNYPFHRAFHEGELELGGEKDEVAALIWSAKEAVVKALGCGFHLVDPLHLRVEPCSGDHEKYLLNVHLINRSRETLRVQAENPVPVSIFRYTSMWVSVASISRAC